MSDFWSQYPIPPEPQGDTHMFAMDNKQVIKVTGPDSSKFMQGQFSCNLTEISPQQFRRGACCNAKGRMISSFNLYQAGDDYLLALDSSLADIHLAHLKKYMVFFKCQMALADYVAAGLKGPQAAALIEQHFGSAPTDDFGQLTLEHGVIIKLPFDAGFELYMKAEQADALLAPLLSEYPLSSNSLWIANLIEAGLSHIDENQSENLIPQMINLGQTGGISFNKGCYTGQEIVARMQYLGKLKRHGYALTIQNDVQLTSGQNLFTADKKSPVGSVVNVAKTIDTQYAFVVLEDQFLEATLLVENSNAEEKQPLESKLLPLPYELTAEEDAQ